MERYLKYYINFKSLYGDNCKIEIYGKVDNSLESMPTPVELTGGAEPLVINYPVDNFIYTPAKFSGATLSVVGGDYLMDLYSNNYQDYKVNFIKDGKIKWSGYLTPEVYSQDYNTELFVIELECISGLATLEHIDYNKSEPKTNLLELIKDALGNIDSDFSNVYIPKYYNKELSELEISSSNFYDEESKGMNYREVLENICKFLNWTVTDYNGNIYFIDYDFIANGGNKYYKYNKDITDKTIVELSGSMSVQDCGFTDSDNTLSIQGGYNKAVVIASDYTVNGDNIIPEYKNGLRNTNITEGIDIVKGNNDYHFEKTYYNSDYYSMPKYKYNGLDSPRFIELAFNSNEEYTEADTLKFKPGGGIIKSFSYDNKDKPNRLDIQTLIECRHTEVINGETNWVYLGQSSSSSTGESVKIYPIMKMKKTINYLKYNQDYIMGINFNLLFTGGNTQLRNDFIFGHPDLYKFYKLESNKYDLIYGGAGTTLYLAQLPITIKIGNYYYNGKEWTTEKAVVMLDVKRETGMNYMDWLPCRDGFTFEDGTTMEGYKVEFPQFPLEGAIEVELYAPYYVNMGTPAASYIKDLSVRVEKKTDVRFADDVKEDTKYENEISDKFITSADDIEFKITSESDSGLSLSKVFTTDGFIDKLISFDGSSNKPEEYMITRIVNQYNKPKIVLAQNIRDKIEPYFLISDNYISNKRFVYIGGEYKAFEDSLKINMIEIN